MCVAVTITHFENLFVALDSFLFQVMPICQYSKICLSQTSDSHEQACLYVWQPIQ